MGSSRERGDQGGAGLGYGESDRCVRIHGLPETLRIPIAAPGLDPLSFCRCVLCLCKPAPRCGAHCRVCLHRVRRQGKTLVVPRGHDSNAGAHHPRRRAALPPAEPILLLLSRCRGSAAVLSSRGSVWSKRSRSRSPLEVHASNRRTAQGPHLSGETQHLGVLAVSLGGSADGVAFPSRRDERVAEPESTVTLTAHRRLSRAGEPERDPACCVAAIPGGQVAVITEFSAFWNPVPAARGADRLEGTETARAALRRCRARSAGSRPAEARLRSALTGRNLPT